MVGGLAGYAGLVAGSMEPDDFARGGPSLFVVMAISLVLTMLVPQALSVLAAYDAKLGRRFDLGRYLSAGLRPIVPLLVCWLVRSEEHTSELQSLMRTSYAVFCLKKKKKKLCSHASVR